MYRPYVIKTEMCCFKSDEYAASLALLLAHLVTSVHTAVSLYRQGNHEEKNSDVVNIERPVSLMLCGWQGSIQQGNFSPS